MFDFLRSNAGPFALMAFIAMAMFRLVYTLIRLAIRKHKLNRPFGRRSPVDYGD